MKPADTSLPERSRPPRGPSHILDRGQLLQRLEPIIYRGGRSVAHEEFEKLSLTEMLLVLAGISHETEFGWCGDVAEHAVGSRPIVDAEEI